MAVEDVITEAKGRLEAFISPINGGVGEDVSYHELFDAMKVEVDKLTAIDGGKTDWNAIANNAEELLTTMSKDFRVMLNYATARAVTGGLSGLLDGFVIMQELSTAHWEAMYPPLKRPRIRGNAVGWFSDTVAPVVQTWNPSTKERDAVMAIDQISRALDADWRDKLGESYGGMSMLREQVRGLVARAPQEAPPPPPPPPPSATPASSSSSSSSSGSVSSSGSESAPTTTPPTGGGGPSPEMIVDVDTAYSVLSDLNQLLFRASEVIFAADSAGADGFRFNRLAGWWTTGDNPPNENGRLYYRSPQDYVKQGFAELQSASDWETLAKNSDEALRESPFWLDGVKFLVTALENLGETHEKARNVVVRELAALLARAPQLPEMTFDDGSPVANEETKAWIASAVLAGGGGGGGGPSTGRTPVDKAIGEAEQIATEGDLARAMAVLTKAVSTTASQPARFRGRLTLARLCLTQGLNEVALAQLEGLEKLAARHNLNEWEPQLATELYRMLYVVRRQTTNPEDPEQKAKLSAAFEHLCQLDAGEALKAFQG